MEKAFAQFYRLPKMLNRRAIVETLLNGCRDGLLVLGSLRSDRSYQTFWYDAPDIVNVKDPNLAIVLSEEPLLDKIPARLLSPGTLPELWQGDELRLQDLYNYFSGRTVSIKREGYEEPFSIPRAERAVVNAAIQAAVKEKRLCLLSGHASLLAEDVPADLLVDDATLQLPPTPLSAKDVIPDNLPEAWKGNVETTALEIADALSTKAGKALPWIIVRDALTAAFNASFVESAYGQWPCDYAGAGMVRLSQPNNQSPHPPNGPRDPFPPTHPPEPTYTL